MKTKIKIEIKILIGVMIILVLTSFYFFRNNDLNLETGSRENSFKSQRFDYREYQGFKLWIDCKERLAKATYTYIREDKDSYNFSPTRTYYIDQRFNSGCAQFTNQTYQKTLGNSSNLPPSMHYDVGHLVNKNHLDHSQQQINESMVMANMHPQSRVFNQRNGAWYYTEKLVECLRQKSALHVWAGVIVGDRSEDDFFTESHGVRTPDYTWKIIQRTDINRIQIFVMPNLYTSTADKIDKYVTNYEDFVDMLEDQEIIELVSIYENSIVDANTWVVTGSLILSCEGTVTPLS